MPWYETPIVVKGHRARRDPHLMTDRLRTSVRDRFSTVEKQHDLCYTPVILRQKIGYEPIHSDLSPYNLSESLYTPI